LSVGGSHSCAAYDDGTVRCWGANFSGQLGVTGVTQSSAPLLLPAFPLSGAKVTVLSAGPTDTCAILEDHSVRCWGGMYGPPAIDSAAPVLVAGVTDGSLEPVALSRGAFWQACVLLGDGSVRCWGTNLSDALGAGYGASSGVQRVAPW
jgi:alpha-tubulin suppressor-like RCC1 family protein